jgi:hypothetical protein
MIVSIEIELGIQVPYSVVVATATVIVVAGGSISLLWCSSKMVRSIATKCCLGATVETVYCHDIFRGNKEKIVYCQETSILPL